MAAPVSPFMAVVMVVNAALIVANILYAGTAILQRKEDPRFEGKKDKYRS